MATMSTTAMSLCSHYHGYNMRSDSTSFFQPATAITDYLQVSENWPDSFSLVLRRQQVCNRQFKRYQHKQNQNRLTRSRTLLKKFKPTVDMPIVYKTVSKLRWIQACINTILNPNLRQHYVESKLASTLYWIQACINTILNPSLCQSYAESKLASKLCWIKATMNPSLCQHYIESKLASKLCWIQACVNTILNPSLCQHYIESKLASTLYWIQASVKAMLNQS